MIKFTFPHQNAFSNDVVFRGIAFLLDFKHTQHWVMVAFPKMHAIVVDGITVAAENAVGPSGLSTALETRRYICAASFRLNAVGWHELHISFFNWKARMFLYKIKQLNSSPGLRANHFISAPGIQKEFVSKGRSTHRSLEKVLVRTRSHVEIAHHENAVTFSPGLHLSSGAPELLQAFLPILVLFAVQVKSGKAQGLTGAANNGTQARDPLLRVVDHVSVAAVHNQRGIGGEQTTTREDEERCSSVLEGLTSPPFAGRRVACLGACNKHEVASRSENSEENFGQFFLVSFVAHVAALLQCHDNDVVLHHVAEKKVNKRRKSKVHQKR